MNDSEKGIALVVTLAIITLATILAVGFATAMRTERQASVSMASNQNAEFIARAAVDHASALLRRNIPQPLPPGQAPTANNWSVAPGSLFVWNALTSSYITIPLSSGDSVSTSDPDLNQVDSTGNPQMGAGAQIKAAWKSVLADPSQPADGTATLINGTKNQIIGRYAFWMDDENSKLNVNTAYGRPVPPTTPYFDNILAGANSYIYGVPSYNIPLGANPRFPDEKNPWSVGLPSSVGLDILGAPFTSNSSSLQALWTARLSYALSSAADITTYTNSAFFQPNKFWLTHVNGDPEFNAFGKARIFFTDSTFQPDSTTAQLDYPASDGFTYVPEPSQTAGGIRDPNEPLTFHVDANAISVTGLQDTSTQNSAVAAVQQIASYLNMKWPGYNHSFVEKWSADRQNADTQGKREAQQVAWNLWGMAANATSGSAAMTGTPPSNAMMNGIWANQIKTTGLTKPGLSLYLWNGPQLDGTWPASRILPEVRAAKVPRFAISFVATQRTRANSSTLVTGLSGTNKYVVNVRLWPQYSLPKGFQGLQQLTDAWHADIQSDEIYLTHFEATIDDQSGAGAKKVIWSSEAQADPGSSCLYWDITGRSNLYKLNTYSFSMAPDSLNYGFVASATGYNPSSKPWNFSTYDDTQAAQTTLPTRSIRFTFDAGSTRKPCLISNVKVRFVVGAGNGTNEAPTQISPMRDIDTTTQTSTSYEPPLTSGPVTDSGAIIFPNFTILTTAITTNTPEYWVAMETLDPRVNARGTPTSGSTTSDDWQTWTAGTPLVGPTNALPNELLDGKRNTRFVYSANRDRTYPQISDPTIPASGDGDESKCAWIDTSNYAQRNPSQVQRRMWGSMPGMVNNRMPSIGMISCISTGIQTGIPWRTIRLQPVSSIPPPVGEDPPDWLLLDLFAIPWNKIGNVSTVPEQAPVPLTFMNSSAGKININAAVFTSSTTPPTTLLRSAPIKGLFLNAYRPNVVAATGTLVSASAAQSYNNINNLYANIASYLSNKSSHHFDYLGELCQVTGVSGTASGASEWEREALIRQLGSLITTRSNVFSVWGVAQTIKKHPLNNSGATLGVFQTRSGGATADDLITGEKRFHAIIQRYVWPGIDGTVGNGQAPSGGAYSQLGPTAKLGSTTNTIDNSDPSSANFLTATYNPGAAVMKYRVVYFEYLN